MHSQGSSTAPMTLDLLIAELSSLNFFEPFFLACIAFVVFNPTYWNVIARLEYRKKAISRLIGKSPTDCCYLFALSIFSLGIVRDSLFLLAILKAPRSSLLWFMPLQAIGCFMLVIGMTFVYTSMKALGLTGTYMGDHFGILMKSKIISFPFNIVEHPMYVGASLSFLGTALMFSSLLGLIFCLLIITVYSVAANIEGKFTTMIYASKARTVKTTNVNNSSFDLLSFLSKYKGAVVWAERPSLMSTSSPFSTPTGASSGILGGAPPSAQQPSGYQQRPEQQGQQAGLWASIFGSSAAQGGMFDRMSNWFQNSISNSADFMRRYVTQYPPLAAYLFTLMALCAIPVSMYAVFAFISSAVLITIAVIGFAVIEGTVLLASGGLLLTVLGTITFFTTIAFGFIGFIWLGYRAFSGVFGTVWQGASSVSQMVSQMSPTGQTGGGGGTTGVPSSYGQR